MLLRIDRAILCGRSVAIGIRISIPASARTPASARMTRQNLLTDIDLAQIAPIAALVPVGALGVARAILLHRIQLRQTRQFLVRDAQQYRVVRRPQRVARFGFRGEEGIGGGGTGGLERENELNAGLDVFAVALNRQIHVVRSEAHADEDVRHGRNCRALP